MISYLSGIHQKTLLTGLIVNVNGVGYELEASLTTLSAIAGEGESVELYIHTQVREDSLRLFGFSEFDEKIVFGLLLTMSGIGPKVALAMISTLGIEGIYKAALKEDSALLTGVPGIGQRLAEKIIVEIKPKLNKLENHLGSKGFFQLKEQKGAAFSSPPAPVFSDLENGLLNLGFKPKIINPVIKKLMQSTPDGKLQDLLRKALSELVGTNSRTKVSNPKELSQMIF